MSCRILERKSIMLENLLLKTRYKFNELNDDIYHDISDLISFNYKNITKKKKEDLKSLLDNLEEKYK